MADIIDILTSAYKTYAANYQKVVTAFALIAVLSFVAGLVSSFSELSDFFAEEICAPKQVGVLPFTEYCGSAEFTSLMASLADLIVGLAVGLVVTVVTLATYKPLSEILSGAPPSDWQKNLSSQVGNMLRVYLLYICQGLVFMLLVALCLLVGFLSGFNWALLLAAIFVAVPIAIIMVIAFAFAFTFVAVELVFSGKGLVAAVKSSYALVKANLADVFVFHLLWLLINMVVGVAVLLTCCLAFFVDPIVSCMIILPIRMLSEIILWRKLKPAA